ncbi:hypothetical protein ENSA5_63670 [Enhygromyxa salina]|uniref:Tetratricopeptide repeat protein n=2 Tax=Enhygromyxa salina TaxID=215803 RepID=A0A2S9XCI0_9BACT|nr:hypothetical protein ENSA5_63670 [Enhygromyxa salina]
MLAGPVPPPAIAVQWRSGAEGDEPDASLRASVRELIAGRDGRAPESVMDRALDRARVAVSRELPADLRERQRSLRAGLDEADGAYRGGRFDDARAELAEVLDRLHETPELPGAAASAREAHLLAAKIAWALGEVELAEAALADALRVDPEAQLSVREAAPELVERHQAIQSALLAGRDRDWIEPQLSLPDGATGLSVEIDGVPGSRPLPPGPHFMVVRRDGHEPVAAWRGADQPWTPSLGAERVPNDPNAATATDAIDAIDAICEVLALDLLVVAERRGARVGLQAHRCGAGFGPLWIGPRDQLGEGIAVALDGPFESASASLPGPWPVVLVEPPAGPVDDEVGPVERPWYRRGWVWGTSAGVAAAVVGGVVAGVLVGGRDRAPASLDIDANDFIGGL